MNSIVIGLTGAFVGGCTRLNARLSRLDDTRPGVSELHVKLLRPLTPRARIVLAVGLFVVGIAHMRTVRGKIADDYFQNAINEVYLTTRGGPIRYYALVSMADKRRSLQCTRKPSL